VVVPDQLPILPSVYKINQKALPWKDPIENWNPEEKQGQGKKEHGQKKKEPTRLVAALLTAEVGRW